METSPTIGALSEALAKAQGAIKGAIKDSANPHFKSKYADLASVWDACRKPLSDNGLAVMQLPGECAANMAEVTTLLSHSSGEWVRTTLTIPLGKVDAHGLGSALTYGRRFSLAAIVGVAPEDDDGNAATEAAPNDSQRRAPAKPKLVSEAQIGTIRFKLTEANASEKAFLDHIELDALSNMRADKYDDAVALIESRKPKADAKPEAADLISDEVPHQEYAK